MGSEQKRQKAMRRQDPIGRIGPIRQRRGMTLVELLVVVSIAVVLFAVAVPLMKYPMRESRLREASRQLNVLVAGAKARAAETGHPVALWLERTGPQAGALPNACTTIYLAETPAPYCGDITGARIGVRLDTTDSRYELVLDASSSSLTITTPASAALVLPNERFRIRFGQQSVTYEGYRATNGDYVLLLATNTPLQKFWEPGPDMRWGVGGTDDDSNGQNDDQTEAGWLSSDDVGRPYQLFRYPQKSAATPVQLPAGVALDLAYSGFPISTSSTPPTALRGLATLGREFDASNMAAAYQSLPIRIAFNAGGSIDHVMWGGSMSTDPDSVHLLVGQRDKIGIPTGVTPETPNPIPYSSAAGAPSFTYHENIIDGANLWVTISARNGSVTTAVNAWEFWPSIATANFLDSFRRAREFAQSGKSMGGR